MSKHRLTLQLKRVPGVMPKWHWRIVDQDGAQVMEMDPLSAPLDRAAAKMVGNKALVDLIQTGGIEVWHDIKTVDLADL